MPEVDLPPSDTRGDRGDKHDAPASFTYVPPSGDHLTDPSVHLVFWGNYWSGNPKLSVSAAAKAVRALLEDTPYLTGLKQYGVKGAAYSGHTILGVTDPTSFDLAAVHTLLTTALSSGQIPGGYGFSDYIYAVVTPLGAHGPIREPGLDGKNKQSDTTVQHNLPDGVTDSTFGPLYYFWVDQDGTVDWFTHVFSHELVELLADPGERFGQKQIGDPCNGTGARLRNRVYVSGYYSERDRTCIAPGQPGTEHSGPFIQSRYGTVGDFELMTVTPSGLVAADYDNDQPGGSWGPGVALPVLSAGQTAVAATMIQSNYGETISGGSPHNYGLPGNLEVVARVAAGGGSDRLVSYWRVSRSKTWHGPNAIVVDGAPIDDVTSNPALIQSSFGVRGNFELCVVRGDALYHYSRENDSPSPAWKLAAVVAAGPVLGLTVRSVALVRSTYHGGSLEVVARMTPAQSAPDGDFLAHASFAGESWSELTLIEADGDPIDGITGNPAFVQSTFGAPGNYEVLVPQGDRLRHFVRDNSAPGAVWRSAPDPITPPVAVTGVSLLQSDLRHGHFRDPGPGHLVAVLRHRPRQRARRPADQMSLLIRDGASATWSQAAMDLPTTPLN